MERQARYGQNLGWRSLVILITTALTIFWILKGAPSIPFTFSIFAVPADSDLVRARQLELAATACLWLAGLSLATTCLTAGFFGDRPSAWFAVFVIGIGWVLLAVPLAGARSSWAWTAYGIGAALLFVSASLLPVADGD